MASPVGAQCHPPQIGARCHLQMPPQGWGTAQGSPRKSSVHSRVCAARSVMDFMSIAGSWMLTYSVGGTMPSLPCTESGGGRQQIPLCGDGDGRGIGAGKGQGWGGMGTGLGWGWRWGRGWDGDGVGMGRGGDGTGMGQGWGWDRDGDGTGTGLGWGWDETGMGRGWDGDRMGAVLTVALSGGGGAECPQVAHGGNWRTWEGQSGGEDVPAARSWRWAAGWSRFGHLPARAARYNRRSAAMCCPAAGGAQH